MSLAQAERKLGLGITEQQIEEMKGHIGDINYEDAAAREKEVRHDVMAHIYAYGLQCPNAAPIIHLGATSCYVGDNADIIIMRDAVRLLLQKLAGVIANLASFAGQYRSMPCLSYTHLQPAQATTFGKRACLWINELLLDVDELEYRLKGLKLLGSKGTTGTQASFLELFDGDSGKVKELERLICEDFEFDTCVAVSGQTYSRKVDAQILSTLSGIAQSAYKFANDIRLLQSFKEMEEPFEAHQVGSSAMPYKRNPMRCERMSALARYVICDSLNPAFTAGTQWFERTLDDSANKRIAVAEAFLAVDSILNLYLNVTSGLVVYPAMVRARLMNELPFMASENIMMNAVKKGGNRQELHERIRVHAQEAARMVKQEGKSNDLLERIAADPAFGLTKTEIRAIVRPELYVGRSAEQVDEFLDQNVRPVVEKYSASGIAKTPELIV